MSKLCGENAPTTDSVSTREVTLTRNIPFIDGTCAKNPVDFHPRGSA